MRREKLGRHGDGCVFGQSRETEVQRAEDDRRMNVSRVCLRSEAGSKGNHNHDGEKQALVMNYALGAGGPHVAEARVEVGQG
jgi:hypothetical protein